MNTMNKVYLCAAATAALLALAGAPPSMSAAPRNGSPAVPLTPRELEETLGGAETRFTNLAATGSVVIDVTNSKKIQLEVTSPLDPPNFAAFSTVTADKNGATPLPVSLVGMAGSVNPIGTVALYTIDLTSVCPSGGAFILSATVDVLSHPAQTSRFVSCN